LFENVLGDVSPTKELIKALGGHYYELSFGKRPQHALFRLTDDPICVRNLAGDPAFARVMEKLSARMFAMFREEKDPRARGNGAIFDTCRYTGGRQKAYDNWLKKRSGQIKTDEAP
jgi:N-sulfoglucosamine sulfohydrolase